VYDAVAHWAWAAWVSEDGVTHFGWMRDMGMLDFAGKLYVESFIFKFRITLNHFFCYCCMSIFFLMQVELSCTLHLVSLLSPLPSLSDSPQAVDQRTEPIQCLSFSSALHSFGLAGPFSFC